MRRSSNSSTSTLAETEPNELQKEKGHPIMKTDPICDLTIDAQKVGTSVYKRTTYYFCSVGSKQTNVLKVNNIRQNLFFRSSSTASGCMSRLACSILFFGILSNSMIAKHPDLQFGRCDCERTAAPPD